MKGWILYFKKSSELTKEDNGVKRLLEEAQKKNISMEVLGQSNLNSSLQATRKIALSLMVKDGQYPISSFPGWGPRQVILLLRSLDI